MIRLLRLTVRLLQAIFTLLFKPTLPHELGHAVVLYLLGEEITSLTFGNPNKKLFSFGKFHIGKFSLKYGGLVETKDKDRSKFAPWQRVAISFAGPCMDIIALSITMSIFYTSYFYFGYGEWFIPVMLYIYWLIANYVTQTFNLLPGIVEGMETDGYKIKEASHTGFVLSCTFVILGIAANVGSIFWFFT